ncbi:MAG: Asp-tRNA(Asn)/Glu-tRNA(Gln) amidotransferase subunit GatA [Deltaproteobacteria bacterium]|nr:Asp-tRNA(Asn)/Glu-tRNA(Gln) amidotransferase subunit GatA [Deltaproteobacteria bacterium]
MEPYQLTIAGARKLLDKRELSAEELCRSVLSRITEVEPKVGAYITVDQEGALAAARRADAAMAKGFSAPLCGIPLAVKDVLCTKGLRTTCGSRMLEHFVPPYDATAVRKLLDQRAVVVGKANMDEFAMGSSTENSAFHPTKNPWDLSRIPGGSSGGSAAAVAAQLCLGSLGSDTGGSIRQPASHCGVVGLKPTYGRVSRYGLVAFASSLDQVGPFAKDVADCAVLLSAICGHDPADSTSAPNEVPDFSAALQKDLCGMKVGVPAEYAKAEGVDPDVSAAVSAALDMLEKQGAELVEVTLPHTKYAVAAYYVIAPAEASSNLARYDGVKYGFRRPDAANLADMYTKTRSTGFGKEVQRRILIGTYALSAGYYDAYYGKASQVRTLISRDFDAAFSQCDMLAGPVAPTPSFALGEKVEDPLTMYLSDVFTLAASLAGIPGMSVPCGFSADGLPIGLQLLAPAFGEETLFTAARHLEDAAGIKDRRPDL